MTTENKKFDLINLTLVCGTNHQMDSVHTVCSRLFSKGVNIQCGGCHVSMCIDCGDESSLKSIARERAQHALNNCPDCYSLKFGMGVAGNKKNYVSVLFIKTDTGLEEKTIKRTLSTTKDDFEKDCFNFLKKCFAF